MKPPLRWFGGKTKFSDWIVESFPFHRHYVEVFGGSGATLFAKAPSTVETYNDLNGDLVNLFQVLRDPKQCQQLKEMLILTPYAKEEHNSLIRASETNDPIEQARRFYVLIRQSFSGIFAESWSYCRHSEKNLAEAWSSSIDRLPEICHRLRGVQVTNYEAIKCVELFDDPATLFYLDPPYVPETRVTNDVYQHEMTYEQHEQLLDALLAAKGKCVLSGYDCDLYAQKLKGWRRAELEVLCSSANDSGIARRTRTEVLWMNFGEVTDGQIIFD